MLIVVGRVACADGKRTHFGAESVRRFSAEVGAVIARPPEVLIHGIGRTNDFPDLEGL